MWILALQHNVRFFLEILQNRKSDTLEWIIILLITGEICVSLYDILHTAGAIWWTDGHSRPLFHFSLEFLQSRSSESRKSDASECPDGCQILLCLGERDSSLSLCKPSPHNRSGRTDAFQEKNAVHDNCHSFGALIRSFPITLFGQLEPTVSSSRKVGVAESRGIFSEVISRSDMVRCSLCSELWIMRIESTSKWGIIVFPWVVCVYVLQRPSCQVARLWIRTSTPFQWNYWIE